MNRSGLHALVAQLCAMAMWGSDFFGHPALGTIFHDPRTADQINIFLGALFGLYGLIRTAFLAYQHEQLTVQVHALPPEQRDVAK